MNQEATNAPNPDEGRATAPLPLTEETSKFKDNTVTGYLSKVRIDPKFMVVNRFVARPLISIPINMMAIFGLARAIFERSYANWPKLRALYTGDVNNITLAIEEGCRHLASAFVLMIYNLLRHKCSMHDSQNQQIYRTRCHFDMTTELPSGVAYLVEHFGYAEAANTHFNPTYLHRWDHENSADNGFGLDAASRLNNHILKGFLDQLSIAGVPFRRVDKYCRPRTLWDSLHITQRDEGFEVCTTYPIENYNLPADIFLALGLCGISSLGENRSICFYPPRLTAYTRQPVINTIAENNPDGATAEEERAMPPTGIQNDIPDHMLRVNGSIRDMHINGVHRVFTGFDANGQNLYTRSVYLYGRGGAASTLLISTVARGVTEQEAEAFYERLLRYGF